MYALTHPGLMLEHIYTEGRLSDKDQGMGLDRGAVVSWYERNRARSRALFDLLTEDLYYSQPIALRHPIVFYEGHLPAFSFLTLVKKGLGRPSVDPRLETLFARGIDPHESQASTNASTAGPKGPALRQTGVGRVLSDP